MQRIIWVIAIVMSVSVFLVGCGDKSVDEVVKDLDQAVAGLQSYKGGGTMTIHAGQLPQEYDVEVWYQQPEYYRIAITSKEKEITQIVLKNDDGVFVLTPHLKKSFRFQSDWPQNQGQVYLYQSLVHSILEDRERQFAVEGDAYVFDVAANYQNSSLARQKIWLTKDEYAPRHVEVSDDQANVLVAVDFTTFSFDEKFDKKDFDMQSNLVSWDIQSLPAMAAGESGTAGKNAEPIVEGSAGKPQPFGILEPLYKPEGVAKLDMDEMMLGEERTVVIRYSGKYDYTIFEMRPKASYVTAATGEIINLDHGLTNAVLTGIGTNVKALHWIHDGVEFRMITSNLPREEMIKVAQSVQGQSGK
jgi:outer membrane lipoprotein-sorting protein